MKWIVSLLLLQALALNGQSLREINFRHLYDIDAPVFNVRPVRAAEAWNCYFSLEFKDTTRDASDLQMQWDIRKSLSDKEGQAIAESDVETSYAGKSAARGMIRVPSSPEAQYLVLKVTSVRQTSPYFYYTTLENNFPETRAISVNGNKLAKRYVPLNSNSAAVIDGNETFFVAHYDDNFPTAPLAFSETLGKVPKQMKIDSAFTVSAGHPFQITSPGLFLVQKDTTSAEGISFRAEADYPRYSKLKSLGGPLIYICTSQEFERIRQANGEKKAFDKVILSITKDPDRAKQLFRSYFQRVESANEFFTSYKEGWKTDRGMIYIIFGPPDEVSLFPDREVWNYKRPEYKTDFVFVRSPSLFDPHNYVLIRNRKYKEMWYEVIDLWRNARF
jgi:GWxTD domain-containing protein